MLGSLNFLKGQLLAEALRVDTAYDAALTAIGTGVAGQFEQWCNRKFARVADDTCTFSADRDHFYLPRTPLESIASVELKTGHATDFAAITDAIANSDYHSGLIYFAGGVAHWSDTVRVTYTGGFWFDTSEDATGAMPEGATALPGELQLAWILQCQEVWNKKDKLGLGLAGTDPDKKPSFSTLELLPNVKETLAAFRRYQIT